MDKRTATMNMVYQYKQLQGQFISLCTVLVDVLPLGNDFGIEIGGGNEISRNITILGHQCRVVFGVRMESEPVLGKIAFQRLLPQDRSISFFTTYFDALGNATETPDKQSWPYSIKGTDVTNWLAIRVLEEFFRSLAAAPEA